MSIAATVLQKAIFMATQNMMSFEKRRPDLGVVEAFDKYTNLLVPATAIANARKSASRPIEITVLNRMTTPIMTKRSKDLTGGNSNSARLGLNWQTYGFGVGVTESINADNDISAQADLANQIEQGIRNMLVQVEIYLAGFIETGKYSALPTSSLMSIAAGAYTTTTEDIFINTPAVLRNLELQGPYHMLSNVEAMANRTRMSTFGANNQQNLQKLLENYEFGYSKSLAPGTGNKEVYYAIPTGSLALIPWVEYDARVGKPGYGVMELTFTSLSGYTYTLPMGYMTKGGPQDKSAVRDGLERAYTEAWDFFVDLAAVKAYSSEAGKSPIVKMIANDPA